MQKARLILAIIFLCSPAAFSQGLRSTPSPTPPEDNDVVKISTSLIQIDVSVTDAKGKVVTDIKPGEIEIYENGVKQKITNFSFISAIKSPVEKSTPPDKSAVPVPPARLRPENVRRTFALVVDDLSLSFESAYQTRRALKKFVDEQMQEGDLVAIIRTGAGIGALQQFTSDKRILYAAIDKVKWNAQGGGGISAFAPIEPPPLEPTDSSETSSESEPAAATGTGQTLDDFRAQVFSTGTLGALKYIVTGMSELPGRKSVILFSDGFKLFETDANGNQESSVVLDFVRRLIDLANRSSVVFYTVDARGLQTLAFTAQDNITDTSPDTMNSARQSRSDQLHDTQEGLSFLAEETGGFAIQNDNDLSGGVRRVMEDQSYYLVAYEPDSDTFDERTRKFNKLEVKVLRKGATARYRSGFFNVADKPLETKPSTMPPVAQLETALMSPFAIGGIGLRLNALFGSDEKTGAFVRSLLHIDARDLKFTDEKDGTKKATFDVLAMSFGDNGNIVDQLGKAYSFALKGDAYRKILEDGFVYQFAFPVKMPGAYQYRVAIRDTQGGKIGSASQFIEVPNLKKNRITLSSIVLENLSAEQWKNRSDQTAPRVLSNPMADTALRRVKTNSVLRYGFEIYNARLDQTKQPKLHTRIRIFREGKVILDGRQTPLDAHGQTDMQHLKTAGAVAIGEKLLPGDYVLQVIVIDDLTSGKQKIATQFVQFEVVE